MDQEKDQTVLKYINYILSTINEFSAKNSLRTCFEERFSSSLEVHRLLHAKDYGSLLLKSLKYISDILITVDGKMPPEGKSSSAACLKAQASPISSLPAKKSINFNQTISNRYLVNQTPTMKKNSIDNTRANTPLNCSISYLAASGNQTPSNQPKKEKKYSEMKKSSGLHSKNLSIISGDVLNARDSMAIINGRRGSNSARNDDKKTFDLFYDGEAVNKPPV